MASYRYYKTTQKRRNPNPDAQKKIVILGAILLIVLIIFGFNKRKDYENYNNIKQNKNQYLVYTKYEDHSTKYTKEVPYVNLKADVFKELNKDILLFCDEYIENERSIITY